MDVDMKSARKKVKRTESYKLATNRKHSIDDLDVMYVDRLVNLKNDRTRKHTQYHTSLPTRLKSERPKSKPVQEVTDDKSERPKSKPVQELSDDKSERPKSKPVQELIDYDLTDNAIHERSTKSPTSDKIYPQRSASSYSSDKAEVHRSASSKSYSSDGVDKHRPSSKSNSSYKIGSHRSASSKSNSSDQADPQRSASFKSSSSGKVDPHRSTSSKTYSSDPKQSASFRLHSSDKTRSGSQKSGTIASSDTDDERRSVSETRKKKSVFRRMKERLLQTFRKSKLIESNHEADKNTDVRENSNGNTHGSEREFFLIASRDEVSGLVEDQLNLNHTQAHNRSTPINIEVAREAYHQQEDDLDNAEDNDSVSKIFDNLIDPETPFLRVNNRTGPDKSKLRLYGLETFRPKSFEEQHSINTERDWTRQPNRGTIQNPKHPYVFSDAGRDDSFVSEQRAKQLSGKGPTKPSIFPVITSLIAARDYREFHQIILKELSSTAHWEQVAWYTYLVKSTLSMVGKGKDLGRTVHSYAKQYFKWQLRPWIESRPNGWESIYEETDIEDSELD